MLDRSHPCRPLDPGATWRGSIARVLGAVFCSLMGSTGCSGTDQPTVAAAQQVVAAVSALPALPSAFAEPPEIELKKVRVEEERVAPWSPADPSFAYVLGVDHGIRADAGGKGWFLAPRSHGKHNGIDFLAAVGEPLLAVCNGKAKSDERKGYGRVVQLVCKLPDALGGDEGLHVSFFYAHLDRVSVPGRWVHVRTGSKVGTVGKTGNASGPKVKPHLHLEAIVRGSEKEALEERHAGVDKAANDAADRFFERLEETCLQPARFSASMEIRRERRVDPFVLLTCAARPKPELTAPVGSELRAAQIRWSEYYAARGFDVDRGTRPREVEPAPVARAPGNPSGTITLVDEGD